MDPNRPESFNHRTERLSTGRNYHFVDQVPEGYVRERNPTLLCVHGFPDLWYGWRHQIGPWVRRGFRVVAVSMLGYGGSSKPEDPAEYSPKKLCADLAAVLDILEIEKAVLIGHDWGAFIVGRFALWHPDRLLALVVLSVPYTPPSRRYMPMEEVAKSAPNLGYQVYFANPKSSGDALIHLDKFLGLCFPTPETRLDFTALGVFEKTLLNDTDRQFATFFNEQEHKYYYAQLSQGMQGPLNYYRTTKIRHDEEEAAKLPARFPADLPFLFVWGTKDMTVTKFVIAKAKNFIPRYEELPLEGQGHWLMVKEAKDEVTEKIAQWLENLTLLSKPTMEAKL